MQKLLYSKRTLALFALLATTFLIAPRLMQMNMTGTAEHGFPLTFERTEHGLPPLPGGNRSSSTDEFDPQALLLDLAVYYGVALLLAAGMNALRRPS